MDTARIAALLRSFLSQPLAPMQLEQISTYINLLLRWNARINLTAVRHPEEIVTRHFGESLFAARYLFPGNLPVATGASSVKAQRTEGNNRVNTRVADLGSGAGFPGLPMKLWAPQISLTLIESNHKKAAFLHEVTRALTLTDVDIENVRAETLMPDSFDVVTLRRGERAVRDLASGEITLIVGSALTVRELMHEVSGHRFAEHVDVRQILAAHGRDVVDQPHHPQRPQRRRFSPVHFAKPLHGRFL